MAKSLAALRSQKIHLTLTLGEVDELLKAGRFVLSTPRAAGCNSYLVIALQKLDEAVNL